MIMCAEGGHFSLVPTACALLFGKHASMVYGVAYSFSVISLLVTSVLVTFYLENIGYEPFYYICSALSSLSMIMLLFLFKEERVC